MVIAEIERPSKQGVFATTRWSVVLAAGERGSMAGERALNWLCERYWYPIYAYARRRGSDPADAEDLVQGFFAHLLESGTFSRVKVDGGKFRSFMLGCFRKFVFSGREHAARLRRDGKKWCVSLADPDVEQRFMEDLVDGRTPEHEFDRAWMLTVLERVGKMLREECDGRGKVGRFAVFLPYLHGDGEYGAMAADAARLGLSEEGFRSTLRRLRVRMRELVIREIRQTVASADDVPGEVRHLLSVGAMARSKG